MLSITGKGARQRKARWRFFCAQRRPDWSGVRRDNDLADRPERDTGKLQVCPGEGQADDCDRPHRRSDNVAKREPPAGKHEPQNIAQEAKRTRAEVVAAGNLGARNGSAAEGQ